LIGREKLLPALVSVNASMPGEVGAEILDVDLNPRAIASDHFRRHPAFRQRARRLGSVRADHTSATSVSNRSSIRTTPLPSADRSLPRMCVPACALLVT